MKLYVFPFLISSLLPGCSAAQSAGDTLRYTVFINQQKVGNAWLLRSGNDVTGFLTYNDRGRGPRLTTHYTVDAQQIPVSIDVTGNDYLKNQVHETFRLANGIARWENVDEKKEIPAPTPAVFLSNASGMDDMLTRALLTAPNHQIALLPVGQASLEKVLTHPAKNGQTVTLYAMKGLGFTPWLTWLDAAGNSLGSISEWQTTIREGFEADAPDLLKRQKAEDDKFYRRLAGQLTERLPQGLAVQNVNLFDAENARVVPGQTVLVSNGRITQVGAAETVKTPSGYRIIDGRGKMLLPGLWDMHAHFVDPMEGMVNLALGVTEIRDMGNTETLLTLRNQIDSLQLIGPRVAVMSGFIDGKGPFTGPIGRAVTSADEGIQAVRAYAGKGYQVIKLYSSMKPEWVQPVAAEAHRLGLRVAGHIPSYMTAEQSIAAGYDEITHTNMVMLNFMGDTIDTRSMGRFTKVAQRGAGIDLSGPNFARFVRLMQQKHIAFDPTLGTFEGMFTATAGQYDPSYAMIVNRMPATVQRSLYGRGLPVAMGMAPTYKKSYATMLDAVKRMHDAGILMVAGTDGFPGYLLHRELELYVKAGIPAAEALQMATYNPAKLSNMLDRLGTIAPGKLADFTLVNGDPTKAISDIRRVDLTVKDGNLYDARKLLNALSVKHYSEP